MRIRRQANPNSPPQAPTLSAFELPRRGLFFLLSYLSARQPDICNQSAWTRLSEFERRVAMETL
jgi:hypothetical protein